MPSLLTYFCVTAPCVQRPVNPYAVVDRLWQHHNSTLITDISCCCLQRAALFGHFCCNVVFTVVVVIVIVVLFMKIVDVIGHSNIYNQKLTVAIIKIVSEIYSFCCPLPPSFGVRTHIYILTKCFRSTFVELLRLRYFLRVHFFSSVTHTVFILNIHTLTHKFKFKIFSVLFLIIHAQRSCNSDRVNGELNTCHLKLVGVT